MVCFRVYFLFVFFFLIFFLKRGCNASTIIAWMIETFGSKRQQVNLITHSIEMQIDFWMIVFHVCLIFACVITYSLSDYIDLLVFLCVCCVCVCVSLLVSALKIARRMFCICHLISALILWWYWNKITWLNHIKSMHFSCLKCVHASKWTASKLKYFINAFAADVNCHTDHFLWAIFIY